MPELWHLFVYVPTELTHCGLVTLHVIKLTIVGSENGLSPIRRHAITWSSTDLLSIRPFRTNFNEIWIETYNFPIKEMHLKCRLQNWRPICSCNSISHRIIFSRSPDATLPLLQLQHGKSKQRRFYDYNVQKVNNKWVRQYNVPAPFFLCRPKLVYLPDALFHFAHLST